MCPLGTLGILGSNQVLETRYINQLHSAFCPQNTQMFWTQDNCPHPYMAYDLKIFTSHASCHHRFISVHFPHVPHPASASSLHTSSLGMDACICAVQVCPSHNSVSESDHTGLPSKGRSVTEYRGGKPPGPQLQLVTVRRPGQVHLPEVWLLPL